MAVAGLRPRSVSGDLAGRVRLNNMRVSRVCMVVKLAVLNFTLNVIVVIVYTHVCHAITLVDCVQSYSNGD
jgi:hypothetical protein